MAETQGSVSPAGTNRARPVGNAGTPCNSQINGGMQYFVTKPPFSGVSFQDVVDACRGNLADLSPDERTLANGRYLQEQALWERLRPVSATG